MMFRSTEVPEKESKINKERSMKEAPGVWYCTVATTGGLMNTRILLAKSQLAEAYGMVERYPKAIEAATVFASRVAHPATAPAANTPMESPLAPAGRGASVSPAAFTGAAVGATPGVTDRITWPSTPRLASMTAGKPGLFSSVTYTCIRLVGGTFTSLNASGTFTALPLTLLVA